MKKSVMLSWVILVASILLIGVGIGNGEVFTVFQKAANICMECIGIG